MGDQLLPRKSRLAPGPLSNNRVGALAVAAAAGILLMSSSQVPANAATGNTEGIYSASQNGSVLQIGSSLGHENHSLRDPRGPGDRGGRGHKASRGERHRHHHRAGPTGTPEMPGAAETPETAEVPGAAETPGAVMGKVSPARTNPLIPLDPPSQPIRSSPLRRRPVHRRPVRKDLAHRVRFGGIRSSGVPGCRRHTGNRRPDRRRSGGQQRGGSPGCSGGNFGPAGSIGH